MNALAKKNGKLKDGNLPGEFLREGLTAVVTVKLPEAEFEGQTKVYGWACSLDLNLAFYSLYP